MKIKIIFCILLHSITLLATDFADIRQAFHKGDYHKLEKFYQTPKELSPEATLLKARWQILHCQFAQAEKTLTPIIKQVPSDDTVYYFFLSLLKQGKFSEIEQFIDSQDPQKLITRTIHSLYYNHRGLHRQARKIIRQVYREFNGKKLSPKDHFYCALAIQHYRPIASYNALQRAYKKDKNDHRYHLAAAEHCLAYYALNYAREEIDAVLKENANHPDALIGQARDFFNKGQYAVAQQVAESIQKQFPQHIDAGLLLAGIASIKNKKQKALKILLEAHEQNPHNLDILSALAAFYEIEEKPDERDSYINKALEINPFYAQIYTTVADYCERNHLTKRVLSWGRQAIECNPRDWRGYYKTGVALLRLGEEKEGYKVLDKSFRINGFNFWAKNMLTLLDKDFRKNEYKTLETKNFVIKYHQDEEGILSEYLEEIVESSWNTYTKKYNFTPTGPKEYNGKILFLIFKKHSNFSVRTVGIPGLGAAGATFGQIITMPSPIAMHGADESSAAFNFKRVFDHEFVHVITLQMSHYKIPRWLTEGISSWEENDFDSATDSLFKWAWVTNKIPPLETMNEGFVDQKYNGQIGVSYYQAALFCQYYSQKFGFDKLVDSLTLMQKNVPCLKALAQTSGANADQLQKEFNQFLENWSASIPTFPKIDWQKHKIQHSKEAHDIRNKIMQIQSLASEEKIAAAEDFILQEKASDKQIAQYYSILAQSLEDEVMSLRYFKLAKQKDNNNGAANYFLALEAIAQKKKARELLQLAIEAYPRFSPIEADKNPYALLDKILQKESDQKKRLSNLKSQTDANEKCFRAAFQYAQALKAVDKNAEALKYYQRAIWINAYAIDAHLSKANCLMALKRPKLALKEFSVAFVLDPYNQLAIEGCLRLNRLLKNSEKALFFKQQLQKHFPSSASLKSIAADSDPQK